MTYISAYHMDSPSVGTANPLKYRRKRGFRGKTGFPGPSAPRRLAHGWGCRRAGVGGCKALRPTDARGRLGPRTAGRGRSPSCRAQGAAESESPLAGERDRPSARGAAESSVAAAVPTARPEPPPGVQALT
jgi:hypothetical protein